MSEADKDADRRQDAEDGAAYLGWSLIVLLIVAPVAWFGFHEARLARVALVVGAICLVVGIVKSRNGEKPVE